MFRTLHSRLFILFLLISLGGIIFVSMAIQLGFNDSFRDYRVQNRQEQVSKVIELLQEEYNQNGVITGDTTALLLHHQAMSENLYYQLFNLNGELVLDSTKMAGMMEMMNGMQQSTEELNQMDVKSYVVSSKGTKIGTLKVYSSKNLVNGESEFLHQFHKYIFFAVLIMIFIAALASFLLAKWLTKGIREMKETARKWQAHHLDVRIPPQKMPEEMEQLAKTFNELAESLSYQESLRKQFTSDLAHELRTPLATLRSQLEAFLDGVFEPTNERLAQSHGELMRLVRLVNEMEKLMAAENPQIQLQKRWIDVNQTMDGIREQYQPLFYEKGISLSVSMPEDRIDIEVDLDRFKQIFANLLNNALKYTPEGGEVSIHVNRNEQGVLFTIADTGIGISKEHLPHVFERFYRGDKSRDRKTGGIGIGLSIVKALVQAHKGQIKIESEQGIGTKVLMTFPDNSKKASLQKEDFH
jgi:two-component system, OmpR family, sensor histidine kinase BaeS